RRPGNGRTNEPETPSTRPDQLISTSRTPGEPHLLAHLGGRAPLRERDVTAIAALSGHHNGRRVIHFLRERELLEAAPARSAELAPAQRLADSLPAPFDGAVHLWIDVLLGLGSRPSPALACATVYVYVYVCNTAPVLNAWAAEGITDLREITSSHITAVLDETEAARRHSVHPPLRSLFRALRRERKIFRDPARHITLTTAPRLPAPLPSDTLKGLLTRVEDARSQLIIALVAIHALTHEDLPRLLLDDLDRARGRLRVRRPGRADHYIYLEEITTALATAWLRQRHHGWPPTTNPHLLVSRISATDPTKPMLSTEVTKTVFERADLPARRLREDRIYDEARHTADPCPPDAAVRPGQGHSHEVRHGRPPRQAPGPDRPLNGEAGRPHPVSARFPPLSSETESASQ
ncbi:hypothetical protein ACFTY8_41935, partial [Streptomyces mirabilis]